MPVDWNRLSLFHQIYRYRNLSRTAETLRISQSAVSQSLARLEEELGVGLFFRAGRGLKPTAEAEILYEAVDPFARELENRLKSGRLSPGGLDAEAAAREPQSVTGTIRVGAPAEYGAQQLAPKVARFTAKFPRVAVEISLDHSDRLALQLSDGRLDFAYVDFFPGGVAARASFESRPVFHERLILVGSARFAKKCLPPGITLAERLQLPHIAYGPRFPELSRWYAVHFRRKRARVRVVATVESVRAVLGFIAADGGLGIVPEHLIEKELARGTLVAIPGEKGREIENSILLLRMKNRPPTTIERLFFSVE